jgi:thiol:disulfide interchange protein DsbC
MFMNRKTIQRKTTLTVILLMLMSVGAEAAWVREGEAVKQGLSKEEAASLLGPVFKQKRFTVLRVTRSPIAELWEIIVETDAGKTILYVDDSKRYFLGGPILALQDLKNKTEESLLSFGILKVDVSLVPLEDALVVGNPKGRQRVVVFLSPTCKPCKAMLQTVKTVALQRKDVAFYLKMLPENLKDESFWRSETIVSRQSLELLVASLAGGAIPKPQKPVPQVARSMEIAERLGIGVTPTIILADGTLVEGPLSPKALLGWIDGHSEVGDRKSEEGRKK